MEEGIRLNKFISESGFCSRREADKLIEDGLVLINGQPPQLGDRYTPGDVVYADGKRIKGRANANSQVDREYIAYNKPINITCTTETDVAGNIIAAIGYKKRIFPIGRLDKMSEGLILLTSDGDIVNKILRAENTHDKEYLVTVDKPLNSQFIEKMANGVPILGTKTLPCKINMQGQFMFKIILTEGLNRQIRRMCEHFGYEVTKLKRVRIMNISLGNLKPGEWRKITASQLADINKAIEHSSGDEKPSGAKLIRRKPKKPSQQERAIKSKAFKAASSKGPSKKKNNNKTKGRKK
ncbi:MAG: 23S rRNA pseudouridine2604 synthase [Kiritimatiellia bacterium]|jgi:23S rRNA pseudouridine2604 synthase